MVGSEFGVEDLQLQFSITFDARVPAGTAMVFGRSAFFIGFQCFGFCLFTPSYEGCTENLREFLSKERLRRQATAVDGAHAQRSADPE